MTLEQDLAEWVAGRPDWQKDAVSRFCRNETLSTEDVSTIADQLIAGSYPSAAPITATEVPGSSSGGDPVRLRAIADIAGVNALLPYQQLTFGESGLTVIYGDNASGKSGYARLIRQAVTARIKADVLGDVFAKEKQDQAASVEYQVGGSLDTWTLGDTTSSALSSVRFFDLECGKAYVTSASEISYRPSALTLLDRLSSACELLQQELARRLSENTQQRPELPMLADGTRAREFLDSLERSTTQAQIDDATALDADHAERLAQKLQEEARLRGSDPSKEKARLAGLAAHWRTVNGYVEQLTASLSEEAYEEIAEQCKQAVDLREAATIASSKSFSSEPLEGVGSETWRALWAAARDYSTSEAYHHYEFPAVGAGAVCVLCQQPLSLDGADRLTRFQAFISDTTSKDADDAERQIGAIRSQLAALRSQPPAVITALSQLQAGGEQIAEVDEWIATGAALVEKLVEWIDGTLAELPSCASESPRASIEARRQELLRASGEIDATTHNERIRGLSAEIAELQAQGQLAAAKENVAAEVERLEARFRIEQARRLVDTTGITRKSTDLTTTHVTSLVRDQFTRETERLGLRRITLDPTGGRRNVTLEHRPRLLGAAVDASVDHVLSEGEQTALGLSGFLTEVEFDDSKSAVVLDDPVSSLDAGRRSRVAQRLAELAQDRQVIVFTHEATFVTALNKAARDAGVEVTHRSILRLGEKPGKTADHHPWSVKDTRQRIHELETDLAQLKKDRAQLDSDEYTRRAQLWGGLLSQAWERAINLEVVNELVDRGTNEVRPRMFRMLVGISHQDDTDYQAGYGKASEWAPRHDQAPETNFVAPEPDEMEAELTRFRGWFERMRGYKK